ncbi:dTDP-4-amino-4,6-dideoxygalactose transaminase [Nitrosomonas sp.]|uniref:dTDP-4-amino-4,6-dideoxygalactose transaminase n=1 Tax=Nitrosomonas sp. TaxID=42353 RepID=UPI0035ADDA4F
MIPFNKPHMSGKELYYIADAHFHNILAGDGPYTKRCHQWLESHTGSAKVLLTHSCTAALEMSSLLLNIQPGDEIIMPSYTFVSTANAFVLRGGVPVFVDIRPDTLNIDENLIADAITERTKAIVPVHYAGVSCEMDTILPIAKQHNIKIVEDAAQGVMSTYKGRALGSIGDLGAYSFHETKNVISGEGGCILINDPSLSLQAEIIREKGTNRTQFFRGHVDKYTWQDVGSSFLPGELISAFLWAQLEVAEQITQQRIDIWNEYHRLLESLENRGLLRRPIIPDHCQHNAHMYYVLLSENLPRDEILQKMKSRGIGAIFHYIPLHSSPAGKKFGRASGELINTDSCAERVIRLPLWIGLNFNQQQEIVIALEDAILNS